MKTLLYARTPENPLLPKGNNAEVQATRREVENAWLAGIIDGEGSLQFIEFCGKHKSFVHLRAQIHIYNTDVRMIRRISEIYKRNGIKFHYYLQKNPHAINGRDGVRITVSGYSTMKKLLALVMPYMVSKVDQAELMREYVVKRLVPRLRNEKGWLVVDDKMREETVWYKAEMKRLRAELIAPSTTTRRASEILGW